MSDGPGGPLHPHGTYSAVGGWSPPASGWSGSGPDAGSGAALDPWASRRELLAALLLVGAVVNVVGGALTSWGYGRDAGGQSWTLVLGTFVGIAQADLALLVAAALALAIGGRGRRPGRVGVIVTQAVSVVGVVVAAIALLGIEEIFRSDVAAPGSGPAGFGERDRVADRLLEGGGTLRFLATAAISLGAAYLAWRQLSDWPPADGPAGEPDDREVVGGGVPSTPA